MIKWDLSQEWKVASICEKSINVMFHINKDQFLASKLKTQT